MIKKIAVLFDDLRMFIGSFFLIVGTILCAEGWAHPPPSPDMSGDLNIDLATGAVFVVFAIIAIVWAALQDPGSPQATNQDLESAP